jgi:quercetin dioxygenase-like cupin family protein
MPAHGSLDDLDEVAAEGVDTDATVLPIGYELRPRKMRPTVWRYAAGDSSTFHRQREQEELYLVLEGRFEARLREGVGDGDAGDAGDERRVELGPRDVLVVEPDCARQLTALEAGELFVVGAPNVTDDGVVLDDEG